MCHHSSAAPPPRPDALRRFSRLAAPAALLLSLGTASAAPGGAKPAMRAPNTPLTFERNTGHWPKEVQFVARSGQGTLFLTRREAVVSLKSGEKRTALRLKLAGANPGASASGLDKQAGIVNYFIGNDPGKWRANVPTYSRVKLAGVYPGIDLVYYGAGKGRTLEYDFVVKPGADASLIRMAVSGAKSLRTVGGKLIASTACGDVTLNRPYAYQTVDGVRRQVACAFALQQDTVAFRVARYDASRPLVVDPTLEFSTYVGGTTLDSSYGVAVDGAGACYISGYTDSEDYRTTSGAYSTVYNGGGSDAFITKLNADGKALAYCTYIGGSKDDLGYGIAVDGLGAAYVTGSTYSKDFPANGFQNARGADVDAFVTKVSPSGNLLEYSTYLGGNREDYGYGIALDGSGQATIAGYTRSGTFPTTAGAYQTGITGDPDDPDVCSDGFVTRLSADGKSLIYSTYLGGSDNDMAFSIALDGAGKAYVCGDTDSTDFPTMPGAYQAASAGGGDVFVAKLTADGGDMDYCTYLGGSANDYSGGIAVDGAGAATIGGRAWSSDFPTTAGAYRTFHSGNVDGFVTRLNASGGGLVYSTFLGGKQADAVRAVAVAADGSAYVTGYTCSTDPLLPFPTTLDAYQGIHAIDGDWSDAFLTKLLPDGSGLTYSTHLGGDNGEEGEAIALDNAGVATICGWTGSSQFPTTSGAHRTTLAGANDGFVARFSFTSGDPTTVTLANLSATVGSRVSIRGRLTDAAGAGIGGKRLQFSIDSGAWTDSEVLTSALGYGTLTITAPAAGVHTLQCRFEASGTYLAGSATGTLTTTALIATAISVSATTAGPGDGVNLAAYLVTPNGTTGGAGVAGKQVEFQLNGSAWTPAQAATTASGKAAVAVTAPAAPGTYVINARFAADAAYAASTGTANLTVAAKRNVYVYTINRSGKVGATGTLIAVFYWYQKNGTLTPVSGKSLRFQCAGVSLDTTATTDASGKATVSVTPAAAGALPFTVDFTADADYLAGSATGTLTVAP